MNNRIKVNDMDRFRFRAWVDGSMIYENFCEYLGSYGCSFKEFERLEHPLMQSTGLRDKNGVLIFEGDILRPFHDVDVCVVSFRDGGFIVSSDQSIGVHIGQDYLNKCFYGVTGNIYENPELVEG
jgi:uncharacterized phage protein (TIGR01671 family)